MREQRDQLKTKLSKKKADLRSLRRSHRELKGKGFPEQPLAKKMKADKQRSPVLSPGRKKDSLRGPQKRAPELPGNSSSLTSGVFPKVAISLQSLWKESGVRMPQGTVVVKLHRKPKKTRARED